MQISGLASYPTPSIAKASNSPNTGAANADAASLSAGDTDAGDAAQEFLKIAKMSPMDRLRANILRDMGLSEDDLKSLSPKDRQAVEQKIKQMVEEQVHKNPTQPGQLMDISA